MFPVFVETSQGQLSISRLIRIYEKDGKIYFDYGRHGLIPLQEEGKSLLKVLLPLMRERLRDWELGVVE
jgi:hypothetical protein